MGQTGSGCFSSPRSMTNPPDSISFTCENLRVSTRSLGSE